MRCIEMDVMICNCWVWRVSRLAEYACVAFCVLYGLWKVQWLL